MKRKKPAALSIGADVCLECGARRESDIGRILQCPEGHGFCATMRFCACGKPVAILFNSPSAKRAFGFDPPIIVACAECLERLGIADRHQPAARLIGMDSQGQ